MVTITGVETKDVRFPVGLIQNPGLTLGIERLMKI